MLRLLTLITLKKINKTHNTALQLTTIPLVQQEERFLSHCRSSLDSSPNRDPAPAVPANTHPYLSTADS